MIDLQKTSKSLTRKSINFPDKEKQNKGTEFIANSVPFHIYS